MRDFGEVLAWLRGRPHPCAPPIGVGEFDILYASAREVVVWYTPARDGHRAGEVAIPCARLAAAWEALLSGTALDDPALTQLGAGVAGGRWLLAVLAQLPGVSVRPDPLALIWAPEPAPEPVSVPTSALPIAAEMPIGETPPATPLAGPAHPRRRSPRTPIPHSDTASVEPRSAAPAAHRPPRRRI